MVPFYTYFPGIFLISSQLTSGNPCLASLRVSFSIKFDTEISSTCKYLSKKTDNISYEEFLQIIDWDSIQSYTIPIGVKLVSEKKIPFVANPYNCEIIDDFITKMLIEVWRI